MPPTSPREPLTDDDDLFVPSALSRTSYFFGQLLTQSDLSAEQSYHLMVQRLAQRETFGTGTVAGLRLAPAESERRGLLVRAGLAMDPDGRELLLDRDVCVRAVDAPLEPSDPDEPLETADPDSSPADALARGLRDRWGAAIDGAEVEALASDLAALGLIREGDYEALADRLDRVAPPDDTFALPPGRTLRDHLFDALVGTTYVGLRYAERGTDLAPAVLDASCCGDGTCFPSRTNEGVRVVLSATPFPAIPDPYADALAAFAERAAGLGEDDGFACHEALCEYLTGAWRPLPPAPGPCGPHEPPTVPLGRIRWDRFDAPTRILEIDNCTFRPLAPGVPPIRALHEVLSGCVVTREVPPRIVDVAPPPRERLPAPTGSTPAEVRLTVDADLASGADSAPWELDLIPAEGEVGRWSSADPPPTFDAALARANDERGRPRILRFTLAPDPQSNAPSLPAGVYRLRVNLPDDSGEPTLRAEASGLALDGNPRAVTVVPSGDGTPGGVFETTFFVSEESR
jgi:hypothetical protein